jgi:Ala-tRNA(Pro) deacylase
MAIAETVQSFLAQHLVEYDLVSHPHTGSSHETAEAAHVSEDHIAKAVIVKDTDGYAMVVVPASNWVEVEHLRKELNRDFHLATEDELAKLFSDCEPGAAPPLGLAYGIETFLDEALTSLANIYFEAGDHEQLVHTAGDDFRTLLGGVRHGYYSHDD